MPEGMIYICRGKKNGLSSLGSELEAWKSAHKEALQVHELEDWIRSILPTRDLIALVCREARRKAVSGDIKDLEAVGNAVMQLLDAGLDLFGVLLDAIRNTQDAGYAVAGAEEAMREKRELSGARANFFRRWPWIDADMWAKTAEDIKNGACQDVEELLREIQGLPA